VRSLAKNEEDELARDVCEKISKMIRRKKNGRNVVFGKISKKMRRKKNGIQM
jgi:hypothetical protein